MKMIRYNYPEFAYGNGLSRLIRDAFQGFDGLGNFLERPLRASGAPSADLYSSEDAYHVRLEIPGVSKDEVKISLENAVLSVSAAHEESETDKNNSLRFNRAISVPDDVDAEKIEAKLENGVLSITLPKQAARIPVAIQIQ